MCGRYTKTITPELIAQQFKVDEPMPLFKANYNISPTQSVVAIRLKAESARREYVLLKWGLIPGLGERGQIRQPVHQCQI